MPCAENPIMCLGAANSKLDCENRVNAAKASTGRKLLPNTDLSCINYRLSICGHGFCIGPLAECLLFNGLVYGRFVRARVLACSRVRVFDVDDRLACNRSGNGQCECLYLLPSAGLFAAAFDRGPPSRNTDLRYGAYGYRRDFSQL